MKNHDPKVPVIQVTTKSPPPENRAHSGSPAPSAPSTKRKLPQSGPVAKNTKRKLDAQNPQQPTAVGSFCDFHSLSTLLNLST
jgi:senataxin